MKLPIYYEQPDLLVNYTDNLEYDWTPSDLIKHFDIFVDTVTVFRR